MGKKTLKLPSLFKTKEAPPPRKHPWQFFPSCGQRRALSFRAGDDVFKKVDSVIFDPAENTAETPESWFTTSSASASFSTDSEEYCCYNGGESLEIFVRGVRSERLFFEPGNTSSILEKAKTSGFPFKESVVLAMESEDPYGDFRRSMEEMLETHGAKDWKVLEELLRCYLRVNGEKNHGLIVRAFVDLLISLDASDSCSDSTSYFSAASSFASSPLYLSESGAENEIVDQHEDTVTS